MDVIRPTQAKDARGFTLLEVLLAMAVLAIIVHVVGLLQHSSWSNTRTTANTMAAGHIITQTIELQRMHISAAPNIYWPPRDSTVTDAASGIVLSWRVRPTYRPSGARADSVRQVDYVARWCARKPDSLVLTTFLSHDF